jgi:membrane-associated phospholipid phosphatase
MATSTASTGAPAPEVPARSPAVHVLDLQLRLLSGAALLAVPVAWITAEVLSGGWLRHVDDQLAWAKWHGGDPILVRVSDLLDVAGQRAYVCTLLAVVAGVLAWRRRSWRPLQVTAVGLLLLNVVVGVLKIVIGRSRPDSGHDLLFTLDQQFPSGHAANAILSWGLLVWLVLRYGRTRLRAVPAYLAVGVLSVAVCAASLYLGYHWLTDLLVGLPLGALLLLVTMAWDVRAGMSAGVRPPVLSPVGVHRPGQDGRVNAGPS